MAAMTEDRNTLRRDGVDYKHPVKAATTIHAGALVALDASGWAVPASTATGLVMVGRAEARADNGAGANGDIAVRVRRGVFRFANSAEADLIARAEIGDTCFAVDDQTVAKTDGSESRSAAGIIRDVDAQGVWVEI